jgi:hypothetical protein
MLTGHPNTDKQHHDFMVRKKMLQLRNSPHHVLTLPCPSQTEKYTTLGAISGLAWFFLTA